MGDQKLLAVVVHDMVCHNITYGDVVQRVYFFRQGDAVGHHVWFHTAGQYQYRTIAQQEYPFTGLPGFSDAEDGDYQQDSHYDKQYPTENRMELAFFFLFFFLVFVQCLVPPCL